MDYADTPTHGRCTEANVMTPEELDIRILDLEQEQSPTAVAWAASRILDHCAGMPEHLLRRLKACQDKAWRATSTN